MSSDKNKLDFEIKTTLEECIGHLEGLLEGLKSGQVVLKNQADAIRLAPGAVVSFAIKARQKGLKESLEIEIDWKRNETPVVTSGGGLSIASAEEA